MQIAKFRYGISFPFQDTTDGYFLKTTTTPQEETKANLIHLLLTRKGSRYFLPDFGTKLYDYLFEPLDSATFKSMDSVIRTAISEYLPNINVNEIRIERLEDVTDTTEGTVVDSDLDDRIYRVAGDGTEDYTVKIFIDYSLKDDVFGSREFIVINL